MSGNGRAAPTRLTQVIGQRRARSVNTTASSCATSTFYAAVPVRPLAIIFAELIAISSNRKNAGSLQGSDSHAIHNKSVARDRQARAERYSHNDRPLANGHTIWFFGPLGDV